MIPTSWFLTCAWLAAGGVGDLVTLRDGAEVRGLVVETPARAAVVTLIVRRERVERQLPEWSKRWTDAEAPAVAAARKERKGRLEAWKRERQGSEAQDPILPWIDRELARLNEPTATSPLQVVRVRRTEIRSIRRGDEQRRESLKRAWLAGLNDPEDKSADDLSGQLEARGFALRSDHAVSIDKLLPDRPESEAQWRLRRAATETLQEPRLAFIRYGSLVLPEGVTQGGGGATPNLPVPQILGALTSDLLGEGPTPNPLAGSLESVAARGRIGALVTELKLPAQGGGPVTVVVTLWVRQGSKWEPAGSKSASARPGAGGPAAQATLENDPQVQAAFGLIESLGFGPVSADLKAASLGTGAATQAALSEARAAIRKELETLALPVGR